MDTIFNLYYNSTREINPNLTTEEEALTTVSLFFSGPSFYGEIFRTWERFSISLINF